MVGAPRHMNTDSTTHTQPGWAEEQKCLKAPAGSRFWKGLRTTQRKSEEI